MATRVTIAASVRGRTDQNQSLFVTDADLYEYINAGIRELHRVLVECGQELFVTSAASTITGSSITLASDFWRLRSVDKTAGVGVGSTPIQLRPFSLQDRYSTELAYRLMASTIDIAPVADAPGTYTVYYVTKPTELSADGTVLPAAYEQYLDFIEIAASIPIRMKAEESAPEIKIKADMIEAIMASAANRNSGPPEVPPAQETYHYNSRLHRWYW